MACKSEYAYVNAPDIVEDKLLMKDSEAGTAGECVSIASGRLTKTAVTGMPDAILVKTTAAGTNVKTEYVRVQPYTVYLIDVAGATALVVGTKTYCLDSTGTKLDSATATGGRMELISIDSKQNKARVRFV